MARLCHDDVAAALPPDYEADSLEHGDGFPGQKRGEAGTSGRDLDLHVDLLSLDRQGQTLCRSVFQALLNLSGDELWCLDDRTQAIRAANFKAQEDCLTNVGEGRGEIMSLRYAAGNCRADD